MRPFCILSVLLRQTKEEERDVGSCLSQLERIEKGKEVPGSVEYGTTKGEFGILGVGKQKREKRSFGLMALFELGIVVLGSCVVIGMGWSLRGKKGVEEGLPVVEPRDSGEGSGSERSWRRWWFRARTVRRHGGGEEVGIHEKTVGTEAEREEEGTEEENETQGEEQRILPAQLQPRLYGRREIEEHIQTWGMGVQEGMAGDESDTEEQEQEEGYDSGQDSELESSAADSIEGVTMGEEIASFRDAFGLVEDMLAAVEQRRR